MDEMKEEKKKESIDDILSDLNGLLNKMPAILEGIKLPEMTPVDFGSTLKLDADSAAPKPAPGWSSPLANDSSAPGPVVPELENFPQKEDAFDKTMKLDESQLPGPVVPEEKDKLVLQSLGEYMFSPGGPEQGESGPGAPSASFSVEPAGLDSAPELPEIKPIINEIKPEVQPQDGPPEAAAADPTPELPEITPVVNKVQPEVQARPGPAYANIDDIPGIYSPASKVNMDEVPLMEPENMDEEKKDKDLEGTKDFGVPDIDAMIKLSMEEALPRSFGPETKADGTTLTPIGDSHEPKGRGLPGKVSAVPDEAPIEQAEPAPAAGSPEEILPQPEPVAQPELEQTLVSEPAPAPEPAAGSTPEPELGNVTIEPAAGIVNEKGGGMELKAEDLIPEPGLVIEQPDIASAVRLRQTPDDEKTIVVPPSSSGSQDALENTLSSQSGPAPEPQSASPQEFIIDVKEPASAEPAPGIERPNSAFGAGPVSAPGDEDKTMVVAPSGGDNDKTVIYEAGAASPATTARRRKDLDSMSSKPVPEGIPPERVRTVAFLYAQEDAALCADVLTELDAICLKSPSKPMFIQRAFVQICDPGTNGNVVMQKVTDAKALGVVVLGEVPQENVYEIENAITAGGSFFRHLNREGFSHSAMLDLVMELILK